MIRVPAANELDRTDLDSLRAPPAARNELPIRMTTGEIALLSSFLKCSSHYLEFGSGGSTTLAVRLVKERVWTVDSSSEWLQKVADASASSEKLSCRHVDIGPVGLWGYPLDYSRKHRFGAYYTSIWQKLEADSLDFVLVDGRFRVASFCAAAVRVDRCTPIGFHDYQSRAEYHCVENIARMIALVDDLAVFVPKTNRDQEARLLIEQYAHNPL